MSNVENLSPQTIRQVVKEMTDLFINSPEGIKVQINEVDVTDIQALLEGPGKLVKILKIQSSLNPVNSMRKEGQMCMCL